MNEQNLKASASGEGMPEEPKGLKHLVNPEIRDYVKALRSYALSLREKREGMVMGMKVIVNPAVPPDEVWLHDKYGELLGKIVNLFAAPSAGREGEK